MPLPPELRGLDPGALLARALRMAPPKHGLTWTPSSPEELAALLPQYRIERLIGHGGMGAVFQGMQPDLERSVAIKLLPLDVSADQAFAERFIREARTLAKLNHPNIVGVYDFGRTSAGHLYFVMEYVEGTDLHRMIHGPGLTPAQSLSIIIAVCEALQYAHGKGIVHRDIKPGNVLVDTEGAVKVADFGLARLNTPEVDSAGITYPGTVMGTPAYMAPEQTCGLRVDHRADIYSLGVMLYEMLCGEVPRGVFDPPSRKVQVDVRLDDVVLKAMRSEPECRYQNTAEMKTDVDAIRGGNVDGGMRKGAKLPSAYLPVIAALLAMLAAGWFTLGKNGAPKRGVVLQGGESDAPSARVQSPGRQASTSSPGAATRDAPFVNTLGMKFVPVPGTEVLFSIWQTRVQDYTAFARENKVDASWMAQQKDGVPVSRGPEYPVCAVSWDDARAFCRWLTETELAAGRLPKAMRYRLPTDEEWSRAAGLAAEEGATPKQRSGRNNVDFPWGSGYPPAGMAGNYRDEAFQAKFPEDRAMDRWIEGYSDGHATTSPVGSFAPNEYGLFDLGGNVWQWCEDLQEPGSTEYVIRGASWSHGIRARLLSSYRGRGATDARGIDYGFRCVLDLEPQEVLGNPKDLSGINSTDSPRGKELPPREKVGNFRDETFHEKFPKSSRR